MSARRGLLLEDAASYKPLAVMRIGTAAVLLTQVVFLWQYRDLLLAEFGLVPWMVSEQWLEPLLPRMSHLMPLAAALGIASDGLVRGILALHAVGAFLLLLGWRTRAAAVVTWFTFLLLKDTGFLFTYGLGHMLLIASFYCVAMPVGREWSVDARLRKGVARAGDAALYVLVLRLHMCIVYLAAGVTKAVGAQWWSGDAMGRALSLPQFQQFDPAPLLQFPMLLQAAAIGVVFAQIAYPFVVWTRWRALAVIVVELIHFGIALTFGLWLFSTIMIVLNMAAFGEALVRPLVERMRPARPTREQAA